MNVENTNYKKIFFGRFDNEVRKIFFDDKDKYMVLSWIIFKTNYQEEYQGLRKNECYFSYSIVESECKMSRKKLQRILLNLESEGFIKWVHKSKAKDSKSIFYLIEKGYGSENSLEYGLEYGKSLDINSVMNHKDTVKDKVKNTVEDTSSINISINKSINKSNNIYSIHEKEIDNQDNDIKYIFEYWNSKKIIQHKTLNKNIDKSINKALKEYGKEDIVNAINNYHEVYEDNNFYYKHKWSLEKFLKQSNGISRFTDEGDIWNSYKGSKDSLLPKESTYLLKNKYIDSNKREDVGGIYGGIRENIGTGKKPDFSKYEG